MIPPHLLSSLDRYATQGIPTGDCLRAILAGDLFGAIARADPQTTAALVEIVRYVVNEMPAACWGSYEVVDEWIAAKLEHRRAKSVGR